MQKTPKKFRKKNLPVQNKICHKVSTSTDTDARAVGQAADPHPSGQHSKSNQRATVKMLFALHSVKPKAKWQNRSRGAINRTPSMDAQRIDGWRRLYIDPTSPHTFGHAQSGYKNFKLQPGHSVLMLSYSQRTLSLPRESLTGMMLKSSAKGRLMDADRTPVWVWVRARGCVDVLAIR